VKVTADIRNITESNGKNKTRTYYAEHEDGPGDKKMKVVYMLFFAIMIFVIIWRIFFPSEYEVWCPWIK